MMVINMWPLFIHSIRTEKHALSRAFAILHHACASPWNSRLAIVIGPYLTRHVVGKFFVV